MGQQLLMKYSDHRLLPQLAVALTLLVLAGSTAPELLASQQISTVEYIEAGEVDRTGIGFLADGKSLFIGGCQPFDLTSRIIPAGCRYPIDTRWATVSPDGSLLLVTTWDAKTYRSRSMQIKAASGEVLSTRKGAHFAPPISIHPSNTYWASVAAGKVASASETVTLVDRSWKIKRDQIYAETQRIFSMEFDTSGKILYVNGGGPIDGASLDTDTWKPVKPAFESTITRLLQVSPDGRFGVRREGQRLVVIKISSPHQFTELDLDTTHGEPEIAFASTGTLFAAKGYFSKDGRRKFGIALVTLR